MFKNNRDDKKKRYARACQDGIQERVDDDWDAMDINNIEKKYGPSFLDELIKRILSSMEEPANAAFA